MKIRTNFIIKIMKNDSNFCKKCGKLITEDWRKDKSRPLLYCSKSCARSHPRNEISRKNTSEAMKRFYKDPSNSQKIINMRRQMSEGWYKKRMKSQVKIVSTDGTNYLNMTNQDLENYRKKHPVCEICGKKNTLKGKPLELCVDHNHKTKIFRGLLCSHCNRQLGWFESNSDKVLAYLKEKDGLFV